MHMSADGDSLEVFGRTADAEHVTCVHSGVYVVVCVCVYLTIWKVSGIKSCENAFKFERSPKLFFSEKIILCTSFKYI